MDPAHFNGMSLARSITNSFQDFKLLEISHTTHHPEKRGPYMVIQEGSDPLDPTSRRCTFALTRKGTWLPCFIFFMMQKELRRQVAVFESVPEVMDLCESLTGKAVVETMDSLQDLLKDHDFHPVSDDALSETLLRALHPDSNPSKED